MRYLLAVFVALLPLAAMAGPADNTANSYTPSSGFQVPGTVIQQSPDGKAATPINGNHPLNVINSAGGGTPSDFSVNAPSLPNIGANFGGTGIYANYVLVATVPAVSVTGSRHSIEINNTSGAQIVLIRDDGTAAGGAAPVNASLIPLAGGAQAGAQGGGWNSTTFSGRVQVYAPSAGAQISIYTD